MNDRQASLTGMGDERRSSSPKRKKIRQKYAPKACVSCRRSKLKCTGENPCQRCIDNGKRCFFSEDETAAQVLQTLSRPAPAPHLPAPLTNGNTPSRRSILPRHGSIERRASDASLLGMTMESRMARIETMMEALLHERGMTMTPMGSIEREEGGSDGFRNDNVFALPLLDPINPALAHLGQSAMPPNQLDWRPATSPHEPRIPSNEPPLMINIDGRTLPFPNLAEYRRYMTSFFYDIHLRHPCMDENEFRARGERVCTGEAIQASETLFLALNYTIFACCDVLSSQSALDNRPQGWHWFQISEELVDKKAMLGGSDDLVRIQLLLFDALYLAFADIPSLAYTTIGIASRLMLQYGLHQRRSLTHLAAEQAFFYISVFWNVFVTDRWISLSCGRPYSIRDQDIDLEVPQNLFKVLDRNRCPDSLQHVNSYMHYAVLLARRAGYIWDSIVDVEGHNAKVDRHSVVALDADIDSFLTHDLPAMHIPVFPGGSYHKTAMILSRNNTLLLRHGAMTNLQYDGINGHDFGSLALDNIDRICTHVSTEVLLSPHQLTYRHQMVSSTAGALIVVGALLVRDLSSPSLNLQHNYSAYAQGFQNAVTILTRLKRLFNYAERVFNDCTPLLSAVCPVVQAWFDATPDQRAQQGFDLVKFLIPPNIADLFPYREPTPPLGADLRPASGAPLSPRRPMSSGEWGVGEQQNPAIGKGTVLWLF